LISGLKTIEVFEDIKNEIEIFKSFLLKNYIIYYTDLAHEDNVQPSIFNEAIFNNY